MIILNRTVTKDRLLKISRSLSTERQGSIYVVEAGLSQGSGAIPV